MAFRKPDPESDRIIERRTYGRDEETRRQSRQDAWVRQYYVEGQDFEGQEHRLLPDDQVPEGVPSHLR